jgi:hypothetical protein
LNDPNNYDDGINDLDNKKFGNSLKTGASAA